jgi:hypothetical protein
MAHTPRPAPPATRITVPAGTPHPSAAPSGARGATVLAWHDAAAGTLLRRRRPLLGAAGLAIMGPTPLPAEHRPGTSGFRYWSVADAVARAATPWRAAADWHWPGSGTLAIRLGSAQGRCVYDRDAIHLAGPDPSDAACRALGHAVLAAVRPALWNAAADEVAAFHHIFADITATLAALQLPERRADVLRAGTACLADTLARLVDAPRPSSFMSAMLGMIAILFSAAFVRGRSADAALELAADKAARLIATALRRVAVVPNFLAQMASELAIAAAVQEAPVVALRLRDLFARGMLLPRSPATDSLDPYEAEDGTELHPSHPALLPWVAIDGAFLGLDRPLLLQPASQTPALAVAADGTGEDPPHPVTAARDFVAHPFARNLVELPCVSRRRRAPPPPTATHRLVEDGQFLRLERLRFLCD